MDTINIVLNMVLCICDRNRDTLQKFQNYRKALIDAVDALNVEY